jgi:hypothetical protein
MKILFVMIQIHFAKIKMNFLNFISTFVFLLENISHISFEFYIEAIISNVASSRL